MRRRPGQIWRASSRHCLNCRLGSSEASCRMRVSTMFNHPWLAYGFRPFFLIGALYAPIALLPWIGALMQQFTLPMALPPLAWHGHEMLFGFVSAALVGFLLTSIPSCAGFAPIAGNTLAA